MTSPIVRSLILLPLVSLIIGGCTLNSRPSDVQPRRDFEDLWDYNQPAETEQKLRSYLEEHEATMADSERLELLTQIARTQGLQRQFDAAHETLNGVERSLTDDTSIARVRYHLERGRTYNSSKRTEEARAQFLIAWDLACELHFDGYAVDAAHMMGIVEGPDEALQWNERAMDLAGSSPDPDARRWRGSLLNNIGWTYFDKGEYETALTMFDDALAVRIEEGKDREVRIARWCRAKTLRMLGRAEESLAIQRELEEQTKDDPDPDGYVPEEIAECLHALGRAEEARPYFRLAYELLSKDPWLADNEPERLARLKRLGGE